MQPWLSKTPGLSPPPQTRVSVTASRAGGECARFVEHHGIQGSKALQCPSPLRSSTPAAPRDLAMAALKATGIASLSAQK